MGDGVPGGSPHPPAHCLGETFVIGRTICLLGPDPCGDHLHSFLLVFLPVAGDLPG